LSLRTSLIALLSSALLPAVLLLCPLHSQAQPQEHDPSLLGKLRDGRFEQVSMGPPGRIDLAAVVQALGDSGCRFDLQSPTPFPVLLQRLLQGVDGWSVVLIRAHPMYARTVTMLADGCESPTARAVAANTVRLLERPLPIPQDELRRHEVALWHGVYLETYRLTAAQQAQLRAELEGQEVLVCWYRNNDPATNEFVKEVRRLSWYRSAPMRAAAWSRTQAQPTPHPLARLGTRSLVDCPPNLRAFETAPGQAGPRSAPSPEPPAAPADPARPAAPPNDSTERRREVACHLARQQATAAEREIDAAAVRGRAPSAYQQRRLDEQRERMRVNCPP
jgi:hypothetical protein